MIGWWLLGRLEVIAEVVVIELEMICLLVEMNGVVVNEDDDDDGGCGKVSELKSLSVFDLLLK